MPTIQPPALDERVMVQLARTPSADVAPISSAAMASAAWNRKLEQTPM